MKLTNEEKDEITWRVVDSLYEKLANELEYELEDHNDFTETKYTRKLSYKEQRELDGLPALIEGLEEQKTQLEQQMAAPDFYQQPKDVVRQHLDNLE